MKVAIIGAGVAGLTTAKILQQTGHDITILDRTPDVGGVWSRTRRYPGVTTQSPMRQYSFSDFAASANLPEWPTGEQVQSYLAHYATANDLEHLLHLRTEVTRVHRSESGEWHVDVHDLDRTVEYRIDVAAVVVANGIFSEPNIPEYPGHEVFKAAGGRILAGNQLNDEEQARGKHVVVVGYGKSACDVSVALSRVAETTDIVARQLLWKVPRKIAGVVNFKIPLLTRLGEALFPYHTLHGFERLLNGPGNGLRRSLLNLIGTISIKQYDLETHGLVPRGRMIDIITGAIGLGTEGFFEQVSNGTIKVHRDQIIDRMFEKDSRPMVELRDGTQLKADLVLCATGFRQGTPFLDDAIQTRILDRDGNFLLYRNIRPADVPNLYFNGYNSSFFCPLNAEIAALWIAADLQNALDLPSEDEMRRSAQKQVEFFDTITNGHHSCGGNIIPFSMHNVDDVLQDIGTNISKFARASQWFRPIDPAAYAKLTARVVADLTSRKVAEGRNHSGSS
ncbi:NAD(P)/FAD-dependent oxidoreductase [Rhodococcus sp. 14-2483-1-2]|uniref:flavin-containing monooxygenase n=1 Tax=Rhodococcus sp. 14-2483-1-2 TaxID=2023147 RepID=UPI000B9B0A89|nr:NAD(P)/FAD-dependent oxidoreductase [Rhodococcus sp. 14-2483-1-2]OZF26143.1 monooxygenase [Rhodococcus sp. 14-2483-1-2]